MDGFQLLFVLLYFSAPWCVSRFIHLVIFFLFHLAACCRSPSCHAAPTAPTAPPPSPPRLTPMLNRVRLNPFSPLRGNLELHSQLNASRRDKSAKFFVSHGRGARTPILARCRSSSEPPCQSEGLGWSLHPPLPPPKSFRQERLIIREESQRGLLRVHLPLHAKLAGST